MAFSDAIHFLLEVKNEQTSRSHCRASECRKIYAFNTLAGERISIVKDTPGVTRDRIYADVTWLNYNFTLIDTGGIEPDSGDVILSQMREQAEIAIATADVIMFITDVRQGLQDADAKVADMLRRSKSRWFWW